MSMSTTRSLRNRSSRYSSPATFTENSVPPKPAEPQKSSNGGQGNLYTWVEPPVRTLVASFEDTKGVERLGVLEHMAPLGVAPSQKLLQKLKVNLNRASPRATPVNREEVTPPMETTRMEVASPIDTEPLPESVRMEESIVISSPPRGRPARKEAEEMRQIIDLATPSPVKNTFAVQASPRPQSIQDYIRQDRMKSVIDRAIVEAHLQSNPKLIPGLQRLWEDAKVKPPLWSILDAILNRTPTEAQFRIFKRYIKRGVRNYQNDPSAPNSSLSFSQVTSPRSQPHGYLHTFLSHTTSPGQNVLNGHSINSPHRRMSSLKQQDPANQQSRKSPVAKVADHVIDSRSSPSSLRKRSRSESSSSSLSSAKSMAEEFSPEMIEIDIEGQAADGRPLRSTGQRQATNRVAAGPRIRLSTNPQSETSQQSNTLHASIRSDQNQVNRAANGDDLAHDLERIDAKRRKFDETSFRQYNDLLQPESDERTAFPDPPASDTIPSTDLLPLIHPHSLLAPSATLSSSTELQARPEIPLLNGTSRKRPYDEIDKELIDASTSVSSSPAPLPPSVAGLTNPGRGATPRGTRLPPPNKARKSARVMVSPNKPKNGGITAGISRAGPTRDSAIGDDAESGAEDNDEYCASCGGEGILLCCDGCPHSFHHGCLEPPLNPDDEVDGEWFCSRCVFRRNKEVQPAIGLFGQATRRVNNIIPKAFALPFDIRDYFEGVKTGEEGEYESVSLARSLNTGAKTNRAGFLEEPNYKETRDNKGNFITCYRCDLTSSGRDIIPCDFCPAKWHTDCVTPPLAVPPRRRNGDKPSYWRCPLHVDGDLEDLGRQVYAAPGDLCKLPRLRKPKKAIPIDIDLMRGFKNNGVIDVALMKDEMPDIREVVQNGGIYRLPEKGIRLDFIDRVKKSWYEDQVFPRQFNARPRIRSRLYRPDDPVLHHPAAYTVVKHKEPEFSKGAAAIAIAETARANAQLQHKSFKEQSAVISLLGLSGKPPDQFSADPLIGLIQTLIAEAPEDVETIKNLSDKELLLALQRRLNGRLALYDDQNTKKGLKVNKRAASEPGLLNGDISEQLNGDVDGYGDDEGDGGSEMDIIS